MTAALPQSQGPEGVWSLEVRWILPGGLADVVAGCLRGRAHERGGGAGLHGARTRVEQAAVDVQHGDLLAGPWPVTQLAGLWPITQSERCHGKLRAVGSMTWAGTRTLPVHGAAASVRSGG